MNSFPVDNCLAAIAICSVIHDFQCETNVASVQLLAIAFEGHSNSDGIQLVHKITLELIKAINCSNTYKRLITSY